jgi:hypothetical protein
MLPTYKASPPGLIFIEDGGGLLIIIFVKPTVGALKVGASKFGTYMLQVSPKIGPQSLYQLIQILNAHKTMPSFALLWAFLLRYRLGQYPYSHGSKIAQERAK